MGRKEAIKKVVEIRKKTTQSKLWTWKDLVGDELVRTIQEMKNYMYETMELRSMEEMRKSKEDIRKMLLQCHGVRESRIHPPHKRTDPRNPCVCCNQTPYRNHPPQSLNGPGLHGKRQDCAHHQDGAQGRHAEKQASHHAERSHQHHRREMELLSRHREYISR